jgi:hypothetical protein
MCVGLIALNQIIQKEEQNLIRAHTPVATNQTTKLKSLGGSWSMVLQGI